MGDAPVFRRWCLTCRRTMSLPAPDAACDHGRTTGLEPEPDGRGVVTVFSDGGIIGRNPSEVGGTWAWCHVGGHGGRLTGSSGVVTPADVGIDRVTNNVTELVAMLHAVEALPEGWSGTAHTDNETARLRFGRPRRAKFVGVPPALVGRVRRAVDRLGAVQFHHVAGHPTVADLHRGRTADGQPVSVHNVWCDAECVRRAGEFLMRRRSGA